MPITKEDLHRAQAQLAATKEALADAQAKAARAEVDAQSLRVQVGELTDKLRRAQAREAERAAMIADLEAKLSETKRPRPVDQPASVTVEKTIYRQTPEDRAKIAELEATVDLLRRGG